MGHEGESLEEFVEAHKTCLNDLMYFPTRNAYGLSSVAGNMEKLEALQSEFDSIKKRIEEDREKSTKLEKKVKTLTHGYQVPTKEPLSVTSNIVITLWGHLCMWNVCVYVDAYMHSSIMEFND